MSAEKHAIEQMNGAAVASFASIFTNFTHYSPPLPNQEHQFAQNSSGKTSTVRNAINSR